MNIENIFDNIQVKEVRKEKRENMLHLAWDKDTFFYKLVKKLDALYESKTGRKTLPRKYIENAIDKVLCDDCTRFGKYLQEEVLKSV